MTQKCTQVRNLGMAHRVLRELRLLRDLAHDNVVTLYGVPPRLVRSGAGPQKKIPNSEAHSMNLRAKNGVVESNKFGEEY